MIIKLVQLPGKSLRVLFPSPATGNASEQGLCKMPALAVVEAAQRADGREDVLPDHFAEEQEPHKLGAIPDVVDLLGGDPRRGGLGGPRARGGRCRRGALPRGGEEQRGSGAAKELLGSIPRYHERTKLVPKRRCLPRFA